MSRQEENVAVVRAALEAFQRGEMEAFLSFLDPEIEIYSDPALPNPVEAVGRDAWLKWVAEWLEAWDRFEVEEVAMEPEGERHVIATMRQHGIGKGSGVEVDMNVFYMFEIRDGLAVRYRLHANRESALAAVRASGSDPT
jgi:ketosteroid isomerase-like protein